MRTPAAANLHDSHLHVEMAPFGGRTQPQTGAAGAVNPEAAGRGGAERSSAPGLRGLDGSGLSERSDSARVLTTRTSGRTGRADTSERNKVPSYVARCPGSQYTTTLPPVTLWTWDPKSPMGARRMVSRCGSWRCKSCQPFRASVDFARIEEALSLYHHEDVVFAVLTIDRNGRYGERVWETTEEAYRELSRMSRMLLKRLNRMLEAKGLDPVGSRWVSTVEAHKSGWPHLNLVMVSKGLSSIVEDARRERESAGLSKRETILATGDVLDHITGAGWGVQSTVERAQSKRALAGYIVKVAKSHDESFRAMAGEVAKMTQVPHNAPKGLRRLRSGVRFLPPRRKSGRTGAVIERRPEVVRPVGRKPSVTETDPAKLKARKEREEIMEVLMKAELQLPAAHKQDPDGRDPTRVSGFRDIEDPDIRAVMERLQLRLRKPEKDTGT